MAIELTNREMVDILNSNFYNLKEIPAKLSFVLALQKSKFKDIARALDESRLKIGEMFSEKDENGVPMVRDDGSYIIASQLEAANREMRELMETEVEVLIDRIEFPLSKLLEYNIEITSNEMVVLLPVINFVDDLEESADTGESEEETSNKVVGIEKGGKREK